MSAAVDGSCVVVADVVGCGAVVCCEVGIVDQVVTVDCNSVVGLVVAADVDVC